MQINFQSFEVTQMIVYFSVLAKSMFRYLLEVIDQLLFNISVRAYGRIKHSQFRKICECDLLG